MELTVVDFPGVDLRDPVKGMRNLADQIEAGDFGAVGSCGVVIFGDTMEVAGFGIDSDGPTMSLLFSAAAHRFVREIEEHGRGR